MRSQINPPPTGQTALYFVKLTKPAERGLAATRGYHVEANTQTHRGFLSLSHLETTCAASGLAQGDRSPIFGQLTAYLGPFALESRKAPVGLVVPCRVSLSSVSMSSIIPMFPLVAGQQKG